MTEPPPNSVGLLEQQYFGNTPLEWAIAVAIAVVSFVALRLALAVVRRQAERIGRRLPPTPGRLVTSLTKRVTLIALIAISAHLGSMALTLNEPMGRGLRFFTVVALAIQAAVWGREIIEVAMEVFLARRQKGEEQHSGALATSMGVMRWAGLLALYSLITIIALDNLGVDITALIAGLGIGGIAVALAAQSILGDLFSSLSIVLDKPFEVGDFIIVEDLLGTVEYVGLKTTRVRSLSGEQLVFSNSDLLSSRIRNFKRMAQRRVVFSFRVPHQTTVEQLELIPKMVRAAVESQEKTRFDRCHFFKFGDSSLDFEVVYHVMSADYNVYMDIQQAINLTLMRGFAESGIDFAYPTRTLYIERSDDGRAGAANGEVELAGRRDGAASGG